VRRDDRACERAPKAIVQFGALGLNLRKVSKQ
jgi:hypothetical protein